MWDLTDPVDSSDWIIYRARDINSFEDIAALGCYVQAGACNAELLVAARTSIGELPEPASFALVSTTLLGLTMARRRRADAESAGLRVGRSVRVP